MIDRFQQLLAIQKRYQEKLSLIMFDLDHFKRVNDTYGHPVGDQTLIAISNCVSHYCRETDLLCRYGGEEFVIICLKSDAQDTFLLAERIRKAVGELQAAVLGYPGTQTISVGVFELKYDQDVSLDEALIALDKTLYQAKRQGRNRVIIHNDG